MGPRRAAHSKGWAALAGAAALASALGAGCGRDRQASGATASAAAPSGGATGPAAAASRAATAGATAAAGTAAGAPSAAQGASAAGPAATAATPAWADGERAGSAAPLALDGLLSLQAPLHDGAALDEALRPLVAALGRLPAVASTRSLSAEGSARVLVRFADSTSPAVARAALEGALRGAGAHSLGRWQLAVIERGARTRAAVSVLPADGSLDATRRLRGAWLAALCELPGVTRCDIAGGATAVRDLLLQPPQLARLEVDVGAAVAALAAALRVAASDVAAGATAGAALKRALGAAIGGRGQTLADVVYESRGQALEGRRAFIGKRPALVLRAFASHGVDQRGIAAASIGLDKALRPLRLPGDESFVHSVGVLSRYRLRAVGAGPTHADTDALLRTIDGLLRDGNAVDALLVEGIDGVPCPLDRHCQRGDAWTLWLGTAGGRESAATLQLLQVALDRQGWRATPLHDDWDTGLGWLLDDDATFAAAIAAASAPQTSAVAAAAQGRLGQSAGRRLVRAGPVPQASDELAAIDSASGRAAGIAAGDAALVLALLRGRIGLAEVGGEQLRVGLPEGALASRHGDLPLRGMRGRTPLAALLRTPDPAAKARLLRVDGWPALYVAYDSGGDESWVSAGHGHQDLERVVEPSAQLRVESAILGQARLSP